MVSCKKAIGYPPQSWRRFSPFGSAASRSKGSCCYSVIPSTAVEPPEINRCSNCGYEHQLTSTILLKNQNCTRKSDFRLKTLKSLKMDKKIRLSCR